jgi:hypothetical protein
MADYKETTVTGTSWQRASRVIIENSLGQAPTMIFVEEEITNLANGKQLKEAIGTLNITFDPANPLHQELYEKINAQYVLVREARDSLVVGNP